MRKDLEEKTISVEKIFKGKVLDVEVHTVSLPDGEVSKRELINHRGAVAVLALTKDNEVILVEQYRKAIEAVTLGYSSELITIYFVDGLEHAGEQNPDDDEFINLKKYPLDEAFRLLDENIITDSKTMLALAYLKNRKGTK